MAESKVVFITRDMDTWSYIVMSIKLGKYCFIESVANLLENDRKVRLIFDHLPDSVMRILLSFKCGQMKISFNCYGYLCVEI
jgi:hypothetical protein